MGIPPPYPSKGDNKITWCHILSENFLLKSAYKVLKEDVWNPKDEKWKSAWKIPGLQRVHFFIWIILKQRLFSNVERVEKGLVVDPLCPIFGFHSEYILHILRDCIVAKDV